MAATVFFQSTSELVTLSNTFKVSGTATDPTAVTLTVTSPSNASSTYTWPAPATLTHGSAGVFSVDVTCSEAGDWQYLWEGTLAASDAEVGTWTVFETTLGKLYAPVSMLKSKLKIAATDTQDDYELHAACFSASRSIEQECERTFYRTAAGTARTFEPCERYWLKFGPWNDLVTLAILKTDADGDGTYETTWAASDYKLYPLNPAAAPETRPTLKIKAVGSQTFPWGTGYGRDDLVEITGVWGWPAVPWAVKQATLMLAEEIQKSTPYGVAGFGDLGVVRVRENPRIAKLLDPYIHPTAKMKVA